MNSNIVSKAIDMSYADKKMSVSFKWSIINGILSAVFAFDLWTKCPYHTTYLHYVEYAIAALFTLSTVHHIIRYLLLRLRTPYHGGTSVSAPLGASTPPRPLPHTVDESPLRPWRGADPPSLPPSPPSPPSPQSRSSPPSSCDRFIADRQSLVEYLREYEERTSRDTSVDSTGFGAHLDTSGELRAYRSHRAHYQLAPLHTERDIADESGGAGGAAAGGGSPLLWQHLQLDPHRLTQWNLNLRLWLHITVLERLVREIRETDAALARLGLPDMRIGHVSVERLRATARGAVAPAALSTLLPFLEPFANQEYLVGRLGELAAGGCLSAYHWNAGGSYRGRPWDESLPTDAELVMHLFATYMDGQLAGVTSALNEARPFSVAHTSRVPERPRRAPGALVVHQARLRPPHYVLIHDEQTLELPEGRNNLLHTLLVFVEVVATQRRGTLGRLHLGRSSLNLLWVVEH